MAESAWLLVADPILACALFAAFDGTALRDVLGLDAAATAAVIASPQLDMLDSDQRYCVQPVLRPLLRDHLREAQPSSEFELHTRAFQHFLNRRAAAVAPQECDWLEDSAMHHLTALRNLAIDYGRSDLVAPLMTSLRIATPTLQRSHDARLQLFDAYNALRRQDYQACSAILDQLLQLDFLPEQVRGEAILTRGLSAMNQARFEEALALFAQAQRVAHAAGDHDTGGRALVNMSWIHNELQEFGRALDLAQQSLALFQMTHDRYRIAYACYAIGNNAVYCGDWAQGREYLERASAIYQHATMTARLAIVDWARGLLYQILGDRENSELAYRRTLASALSAEQRNPVTAMDTLIELGILYHSYGQLERAEEAYRQALEFAEQLNAEHRRALLLHRLGRVLWRQQRPANARDTLALAVAAIEQLRVLTSSESIKIGLLGTAQQVYESIVLLLLEQHDVASVFAYIERARARAFLDLLHQRGAAADVAEYQLVDLAAVQRRLPPDAVLLEYFALGVLPRDNHFVGRIPSANTRLRAELTTPPQIILLAITRDTITLHQLNVDPNLLQPSAEDRTPGRHILTERKLRWLYDKLLKPVEQLLSCRLLYLVPHGPLHYIPFAALSDASGTTLLRQDGPVIVYAPSATILCACLERQPAAEGSTLALGYDDTGPAMLRFAEREARLVGQVMHGEIVVGEQAKREQLITSGPALRHLHIAGHAVYLPHDPLGSYLRLSADEQIDARTLMQSLSLPGSVITLNACLSGVSHVASGDELLGLPRAFLYAGAATIVCALHEVDDLSSCLLMALFYRFLADHSSPAAALQQAQLVMRQLSRAEVERIAEQLSFTDPLELSSLLGETERTPFAHPRYWAPFIVIGKP